MLHITSVVDEGISVTWETSKFQSYPISGFVVSMRKVCLTTDADADEDSNFLEESHVAADVRQFSFGRLPDFAEVVIISISSCTETLGAGPPCEKTVLLLKPKKPKLAVEMRTSTSIGLTWSLPQLPMSAMTYEGFRLTCDPVAKVGRQRSLQRMLTYDQNSIVFEGLSLDNEYEFTLEVVFDQKQMKTLLGYCENIFRDSLTAATATSPSKPMVYLGAKSVEKMRIFWLPSIYHYRLHMYQVELNGVYFTSVSHREFEVTCSASHIRQLLGEAFDGRTTQTISVVVTAVSREDKTIFSRSDPLVLQWLNPCDPPFSIALISGSGFMSRSPPRFVSFFLIKFDIKNDNLDKADIFTSSNYHHHDWNVK